ncbi:hypothetical protein B0A50_03603 [Salinomyces thailandicus]|uniref:Exonuclease domain-containing protein n=1 Tax=Salinomyces thailandicus TaxID=706561 RepID=A0A4U0U3H4_9PEZI|nr:hypothetical protein B0A50_03603 [Salinomyces thailandica]
MGASALPNERPRPHGRNKPRAPSGRRGYQVRATQITRAWSLVTPVLTVDLEGCQRDRKSFVGSISICNEQEQAVYDVYGDHGGFRTKDQFITGLPPKSLNLGVDWADLNPKNGAKPIKEVLENVAKLFEGRTVVFHDYKSDRRMMDASSAMCGVQIPWDTVTVRDTQRFSGYQKYACGSNGPALKVLAQQVLNIQGFQENGHRSLTDAVATYRLYAREKRAFEEEFGAS